MASAACSISTARNLSISSPAAAVAAESRQPSAIQKPRGPADGRRWLCIAACADRTRGYLAGPVVASSERRQHRAPSGPQALRARTLAPFSTRCHEPYLATRAETWAPRARFPSPTLPFPSPFYDLLTDPLFKNVWQRCATCCNRGPLPMRAPRSGLAFSRFLRIPIIPTN